MKYTAEDFRCLAIREFGDRIPWNTVLKVEAALRIAARVAEAFSVEVIDGLNVSHDPVLNLAGALIDLERGQNPDEVSLRTIKRVQAQLVAIRTSLTSTEDAT